jgi:hypothetical protein
MTLRTRHVVVMVAAVLIGLLGGASRASAQVTYYAFTQSGGFDANGKYGVGKGLDLNSAMFKSQVDCSKQSLICGDEGYCALRPGLFGAWASNLKVAGGRGISCNQPTQALANADALAQCGTIHLGGGPPCRILWPDSGPQASSIDELKAWVRTNFRQVVGRAPSEDAVNDYASQLQAWTTRAPVEKGQEYLLTVVFPSLR